ncbi:type III secretory pathway component EscR [Virgibacillus halotolerans]|uniref:hypothetical protein n=1 Tax=Virgibacillus halotolerans TaxID=1071053 RepID=UPI00195F7511|nr:hypothetical protein [Virgibacillus halotolerans]MBM7601780.1 type III secretory pathway component EscR [Virgibacillus halotolerans]
MKKNIVLYGLVAIISIFLFSPRSRKAVSNTINEDTLNKIYEFKNILTDWKENQNQYK